MLYEKMKLNAEALKKDNGLTNLMVYPSGDIGNGVTVACEMTMDGNASVSKNLLIGKLPAVAGNVLTAVMRSVKCRGLRVVSVQQMIHDVSPERVVGVLHLVFAEK